MHPLKRKRLALGMTQTELARRLGVRGATVSKWECGGSIPEPEQYPKLAEVFSITPEEVTYLFAPAAPLAPTAA